MLSQETKLKILITTDRYTVSTNGVAASFGGKAFGEAIETVYESVL